MAAEIRRSYNVPLRRGFRNAKRYKKTSRAISELRSFIQQHMKTQEVKIDKTLNVKVWEHGIRNPPHHIKVDVVKDAEGVARVYLEGQAPGAAKSEKAAEKEEAKKATEPAKKEEVKAEKEPVAKEDAKAPEEKPEAKPEESAKPAKETPKADKPAEEKKAE